MKIKKKNLFSTSSYPVWLSTSSNPVWRARASRAFCRATEGGRQGRRPSSVRAGALSDERRAIKLAKRSVLARQSGALSFVRFFGRAKKRTRRLGGGGKTQGRIFKSLPFPSGVEPLSVHHALLTCTGTQRAVGGSH